MLDVMLVSLAALARLQLVAGASLMLVSLAALTRLQLVAGAS
ncbi:MAG: hypothetical protein WKF58_05685 [Ilumatobacteraceae bacterium]